LYRRNPVSVHHSCPQKSGVSSPFLPEKMNRHRITPRITPDTGLRPDMVREIDRTKEESWCPSLRCEDRHASARDRWLWRVGSASAHAGRGWTDVAGCDPRNLIRFYAHAFPGRRDERGAGGTMSTTAREGSTAGTSARFSRWHRLRPVPLSSLGTKRQKRGRMDKEMLRECEHLLPGE
jgi:hypothetical protein